MDAGPTGEGLSYYTMLPTPSLKTKMLRLLWRHCNHLLSTYSLLALSHLLTLYLWTGPKVRAYVLCLFCTLTLVTLSRFVAPNTVSAMMISELINLTSTFPLWFQLQFQHSNLNPNQNTFHHHSPDLLSCTSPRRSHS